MMNELMNTYFETMREAAKSGAYFTAGESYAYRAWEYSRRWMSSELECDSFPTTMIQDITDFVITLRKSGAETLAVTETSTALMSVIHSLCELGCTMEGTCTVVRKFERPWGTEEETVQGIRFRLN